MWLLLMLPALLCFWVGLGWVGFFSPACSLGRHRLNHARLPLTPTHLPPLSPAPSLPCSALFWQPTSIALGLFTMPDGRVPLVHFSSTPLDLILNAPNYTGERGAGQWSSRDGLLFGSHLLCEGGELSMGMRAILHVASCC